MRRTRASLIGPISVCVLLASLAVGSFAPAGAANGAGAGAPSIRSLSSTTTTVPGTSTTSTTTPPAKPKPVPTLQFGSHGASVLIFQRRLVALGYWLGTPDGTFGDSTLQAVYALQKAAGIARDGVVGPLTRAALARGARPRPRSTGGRVIEVDLATDLLMIVNQGHLVATLNTSTGGGYTYVVQGVAAIAETPIGVFHIYRQVNGLVTDALGQLWRPKYFDSGFAIHGDSYVPAVPVSHGCVRVSNEAIDWIWAANLMPLGTEVWIYS